MTYTEKPDPKQQIVFPFCSSLVLLPFNTRETIIYIPTLTIYMTSFYQKGLTLFERLSVSLNTTLLSNKQIGITIFNF